MGMVERKILDIGAAVDMIIKERIERMFIVNLNDVIKVRLTDLGKDIYYHRYDNLNRKAGREICEPKFPDVDEEGYTSFQLWDFISLYGGYIGMARQNVIEPLDIICPIQGHGDPPGEPGPRGIPVSHHNGVDGVFIRGMQVPKTCCTCPLIVYMPDIEWNENGKDYVGAYCCKITGELIDNTKREEHCPICVDQDTQNPAEWKESRTQRGWNGVEFPTHAKCSACGGEVPYLARSNYCPHCGREMEGVK